jgi:hypothetical protein
MTHLKETVHATITNKKWLMMFREIIAVYSENYTQLLHTKYRYILLR